MAGLESREQLRATAEQFSNIPAGVWTPQKTPEVTLTQPFRSMAFDIASWFMPHQRWTLTEVVMGATQPPRVLHYFKPNMDLGASEEEPERLSTVVKLTADDPPVAGGTFLSGPKRLDFISAFTPKILQNATMVDALGIVAAVHVKPDRNLDYQTISRSFF